MKLSKINLIYFSDLSDQNKICLINTVHLSWEANLLLELILPRLDQINRVNYLAIQEFNFISRHLFFVFIVNLCNFQPLIHLIQFIFYLQVCKYSRELLIIDVQILSFQYKAHLNLDNHHNYIFHSIFSSFVL